MNVLIQIRRIAVLMSIVGVTLLSAMENKGRLSDAELLAKKQAFALEVKERRERKFQWITYPEGINPDVDVDALNKELGLLGDTYKICGFGQAFMFPAGMDVRFLHNHLLPQKNSEKS